MDGWNTSFLLGWPIFRGYVSFRESISCKLEVKRLSHFSNDLKTLMDGTGKNLASLEVVPCFGIETFGRSDRFQLWLALHLNTELNLMNQVGSTDTRQKHFAKEGAYFFLFARI